MLRPPSPLPTTTLLRHTVPISISVDGGVVVTKCRTCGRCQALFPERQSTPCSSNQLLVVALGTTTAPTTRSCIVLVLVAVLPRLPLSTANWLLAKRRRNHGSCSLLSLATQQPHSVTRVILARLALFQCPLGCLFCLLLSIPLRKSDVCRPPLHHYHTAAAKET